MPVPMSLFKLACACAYSSFASPAFYMYNALYRCVIHKCFAFPAYSWVNLVAIASHGLVDI
jgi:hypothetical protein